MDNINNLPIAVKQNKLSTKIKNGVSKTGKIVGYSLATLGLVAGAVYVPVISVPAIIGAAYTSNKLLNNTLNKSYKDLCFVTRKIGSHVKIFQDPIRIDMLKKMKDLNNIEKAGFIQLQAIVGLSKFEQFDKKGNKLTFETLTHRINQKTFKTLRDLGYIDNYEETYKKDSNLIVAKLAFGNIKGIKNKNQMYNLTFTKTEKPVDINDEKLRKSFPIVFSKRKGILANKDYGIIQKPDGTLEIDYSKKERNQENITEVKKEQFIKELKEGTKSLNEQNEYSKELQDKNKLMLKQQEIQEKEK